MGCGQSVVQPPPDTDSPKDSNSNRALPAARQPAPAPVEEEHKAPSSAEQENRAPQQPEHQSAPVVVVSAPPADIQSDPEEEPVQHDNMSEESKESNDLVPPLARPVSGRSPRSAARSLGDRAALSPAQVHKFAETGGFHQARQHLTGFLAQRPTREKLVELNVISEDGKEAPQQSSQSIKSKKTEMLNSFFAKRPSLAQLREKRIFVDEEEEDLPPMRQRQNTLEGLLAHRPNMSVLKQKGILPDVAEKKHSLSDRKKMLGNFIRRRPSMEFLHQKKIITDIGYLPVTPNSDNEMLPVQINALNGVNVQVAALGWGHSAVIGEKGEVYTYGEGSNGRLGHGDETTYYEPKLLKALQEVGAAVDVAVGDNHTVAVVTEKEGGANALYTWGQGAWGRLGLGDTENRLVPSKVDLKGEEPTAVAAGSYHTVVLTKSGKVYSFGWNKNGRLGISANVATVPATPSRSPARTPGPSVPASPASPGAGSKFSFASKLTVSVPTDEEKLSVPKSPARTPRSGHGFTTGSLRRIKSGQSGPASALLPTQIEFLTDKQIVKISAGQSFTHALSAEGDLYSWGSGAFGALGHEVEDDLSTPAKVESFADKGIAITDVQCGGGFVLALAKDGQLYSFGDRKSKQLGREAEDLGFIPSVVSALEGKAITSFSAGKAHAAALADGKVYTWGIGSRGQLGLSDEQYEDSAKPVPVPTAVSGKSFRFVPPVQVACGWDHTAVLLTDGAFLSMGDKRKVGLPYLGTA